MPKRILIDATHVEETRVAVLEDGRISGFDSETSIKKQLKGNIYLAKITRIEPSLQAAFVDYGGDKHGFLPFSEINPNYYNIPVSDKEELIDSIRSSNGAVSSDDEKASEGDSAKSEEAGEDAGGDVDVVSGGEEEEEKAVAKPTQNLYRKYKIQEVMKTGQIILAQVEKEERGNKGASLTTFISLAGRYCVFMPNSLRGGGVSRRVDSSEDRKKLKAILQSLNIPKEMGVIVRTAGAKRGEEEIREDYNYLANLWNEIKEKTVISTAPAFIHAEGSLIKRIVRDVYGDSVSEMLIEGHAAYKEAKDFMKTVMPSGASRIKEYKNKVPIYTRYKVEEQISSLYGAETPLKSGGALVINPTEALISIDVNSGRSTSQRSVEDTAVNTNVEAAYEVARQLKLRDLSGLIVIDFIDMMDLRNKKSVEKALKDALSDDKAKIQIGRISSFGLLEMSRQRLRASFLEINTMVCPHCDGAGVVKSTESTAVNVLRALENELSRGPSCTAADVFTSSDIAISIMNNKRDELAAIEAKYSVKIFFKADSSFAVDGFRIEKKLPRGRKPVAEKTNDNRRETTRSAKVEKPIANSNENKTVVAKRSPVAIASNLLEGLWKKIID